MISIEVASCGWIKIVLWKFTLNARGDITRYSDEWGDFEAFGWFALSFGVHPLIVLEKHLVKHLIKSFNFQVFREGGFELEIGDLYINAEATLNATNTFPFGWFDVTLGYRALLRLGYMQRWLSHDYVMYKFRMGESITDIARRYNCTNLEIEDIIRQQLWRGNE